MTEAPLSANFNLYQGQLKVQFTYRQAADDGYIGQLQAYIANLNSAGFTVEPQAPVEGEKEQAIDGYVAGMFQNSKTGDFDARLHLYAEPGGMKFRVVDVYPEDFEKLGFTPDLSKQVDGPAPEKAYAKSRGYYVHHPMTIVTVPKLDYDTGEPKRTEAGNIIYKFSHVVSATQPAPSQQQQARPSAPVNGNGHKPAPPPAASNGNPFDDETVGAHNPVLHALGTAFYANQWSAKRKEFSAHFGKSSSKDWSPSQTQSVIDGLEGHLWTAIYEIANDKGWNEERLDNITHKARKGAAMSDVSGVMLTHVYKAVQEAAVNDVKLPEGDGLPF